MRHAPTTIVRYFAGLDLGQQQQHTALAVLERTTRFDPRTQVDDDGVYAVRHLERFSPATAYAAIFERVGELLCEEPLMGCRLVVDQTGVGKAVVDLLNNSIERDHIRRVTITTGLSAIYADGG